MPLRIVEAEKEGHRKVKTDFRKKALTGDHPFVKALAGGVKGKPHSSKEGRVASAGRKIKRISQGYKPKWPPKGWQDFGKRKYPRPKENLIEKMGGSEKAKPHSTKEGRVASGERRIRRILEDANKPRLRPKGVPPGGWKPQPDWSKRKPTPAIPRAKHGLGNIVKKIISKIKPKPKGPFKPKPVPKDVLDRPTGWSPKGSYTKADDKKINSMLKNLGDEIKAAPLPPQLKKTLKKAQKAFPHKKAKGGRIGLKHGTSAQSHYLQHGYGPYKIQLRSGKPKLAKKGW